MRQIFRHGLIATLLLSLLILPAPRSRAQTQAGITDDEIKNILRDRVEVARQSVGIVVGLVDEQGTRVISYGKTRIGRVRTQFDLSEVSAKERWVTHVQRNGASRC